MIELKKLSKTFESASGPVEALRDIDLTINDGEIFGIIGLSGAGKSIKALDNDQLRAKTKEIQKFV